MGRVREFAEKMWNESEAFSGDSHPLALFAGLEQIDDGMAFLSSFSNITALETGDGLVMIDTGGFMFARAAYDTLRGWSTTPLHTAVYTHGHADHVFGLGYFDKEAADKGWNRPHVVAHDALPARFDRYTLTAGYNAVINARQFRAPGIKWPTDYRYPDETFAATHTLDIGGEHIELFHDKGETDDHVWAWIPGRKVICTGDLFIWAAPNCGNPQKVQRYPREWAMALRKMAKLPAETLFPGHGPPIFGRDRIARALDETAQLMETVHDQTLAMMNEGARLDDIIHSVQIPEALLRRPYLRPVYDEPAFIIRNVWRLYGGWYDGNPARLKPAPDAALAAELATLAGGADKLAARATELAASGSLDVACHLAELARQAAPDSDAIKAARADVYARRAEGETSLMAKSIYRAAAED